MTTEDWRNLLHLACGFFAGASLALLAVFFAPARYRTHVFHFFHHHRLEVTHRVITPPDDGEAWKRSDS